MDWFNHLGNYQMLLATPSLAMDMSTASMSHDLMGYPMAYDMQDAPVTLQSYPPDNPFLEA